MALEIAGWIVSVVANEVASEITLNINAVCFEMQYVLTIHNPPLRP